MPSIQTFAIATAAIVAVGLGAGAYIAFSGGNAFAECGGGMATGGATIGGPFTLVSETGETVQDTDIITRPTLIYFGYTFCPDVCPTDVAVMAQAASILEENGAPVNTAFVSVDPARDTPEVVGDFTGLMHDDMIGLTGSEEQVAAAAKAYKVYYQKAEGDDPEYYLMDHSAFIYLMAPNEGFLQVYRRGETPESIAENVGCFVDAIGA